MKWTEKRSSQTPVRRGFQQLHMIYYFDFFLQLLFRSNNPCKIIMFNSKRALHISVFLFVISVYTCHAAEDNVSQDFHLRALKITGIIKKDCQEYKFQGIISEFNKPFLLSGIIPALKSTGPFSGTTTYRLFAKLQRNAKSKALNVGFILASFSNKEEENVDYEHLEQKFSDSGSISISLSTLKGQGPYATYQTSFTTSIAYRRLFKSKTAYINGQLRLQTTDQDKANQPAVWKEIAERLKDNRIPATEIPNILLMYLAKYSIPGEGVRALRLHSYSSKDFAKEINSKMHLGLFTDPDSELWYQNKNLYENVKAITDLKQKEEKVRSLSGVICTPYTEKEKEKISSSRKISAGTLFFEIGYKVVIKQQSKDPLESIILSFVCLGKDIGETDEFQEWDDIKHEFSPLPPKHAPTREEIAITKLTEEIKHIFQMCDRQIDVKLMKRIEI